jgi:glycosyltransferase involved in cell wall biosynthesis
MKFLFIHQNFPGQYVHLVRHLAAQRRHEILFITQPNSNEMEGVRKLTYPRDERLRVNCHAYSVEFDRAIYAAAQVAEICREQASRGFWPDLVIGHSGWGETLFVKDVFPGVPVLANFEFYYHYQGVDVGFDAEFASVFQDPLRLRARNTTNLLAFEACDWGHCATQWQRSLYPESMRTRMTAIHEGVDTDIVRPNLAARFTIPGSPRTLTRRDEIITYAARNLEPYRGFHVFMRSLPELLRLRKRAQVVIAGGDGVSYGMPPPPKSSFREMMLLELEGRLDLNRVHFVGRLEYHDYLNLLQVSSAHIYLTYPFVLSWSFIEALASGCLIVASNTPPVLEILREGVNGRAVDFFSHGALAEQIAAVLERPSEAKKLRDGARATAVTHFDLKKVLLPRWEKLIGDLAAGRRPTLEYTVETRLTPRVARRGRRETPAARVAGAGSVRTRVAVRHPDFDEP